VKRRDLVKFAAGVAIGWPAYATHAQQPVRPVIGFLGSASPERWADRMQTFHQGLSEVGYVEGRNVAIEYRWAEGHYDRLSALAGDLVRRQVSVISAPGSTPAAIAAKEATTTIPIVFAVGSDPVKVGLVASLNRPGGNITGVTTLTAELDPKRVELLHELVPTNTTIAVLINPTNPALAEPTAKDVQAAARILGRRIYILHASTERDFEAAFATLAQMGAGALIIGPDAFYTSHAQRLAELTLRHAIPAIASVREFPMAGGLMSYGGNFLKAHHDAGVYTGRILKGENPAELPVEQSTKLELVVNLKTANALGLAVPLLLSARADEIIE
jgi:putative tryptophan/tyrosine transport system substrate-binding protein